MYTPRSFACTDDEVLRRFVEDHPFATLIVAAPTLEIGFAPCLLDRERVQLRLHLARANPLAGRLAEGTRATAIFHGPHAYVSASWYGDPPNEVPTWNYAVVVVRGGPARVLDAVETRRQLADLAARFDDRWRLENANPMLVDELLPAIVALEIPIESIEGKFKLSQNRAPDDRRRVQERLASGSPTEREVAALMRALGIGI